MPKIWTQCSKPDCLIWSSMQLSLHHYLLEVQLLKCFSMSKLHNITGSRIIFWIIFIAYCCYGFSNTCQQSWSQRVDQYFMFTENKIKQQHSILWMQVAKHGYVWCTTEKKNQLQMIHLHIQMQTSTICGPHS